CRKVWVGVLELCALWKCFQTLDAEIVTVHSRGGLTTHGAPGQ
ncbi:unnamed protein product, partial [Staurois parvus]